MNGATLAAYRNYDRDPVIHPTETRADVANGPYFRMNRGAKLVWVTDADGVPRWLTQRQVEVLYAIRRLAGSGVRVPMRTLARHLSVSPSTVCRAAVKLTAYGFIAYQSNRGRYGGTVFVLRRTRDGLDWCRDAAKATVRRWAKATAERFSRLISNVAPYPTDERWYAKSTTYSGVSLGRNIKTEWSWQEVEDALR